MVCGLGLNSSVLHPRALPHAQAKGCSVRVSGFRVQGLEFRV